MAVNQAILDATIRHAVFLEQLKAGEVGKFAKGATRASVGADGVGQVSASLDYYHWLQQQPASFQDAAIGPKRAKLFREGRLSVQRFAELQLDRNFAPLTLVQMKALEPLAFERAGLLP